jgi:hypothetical protein
MILEVQAATAGHAHVRDKATDPFGKLGVKKGFGVGEGQDLVVDRGQQQIDGVPDAQAIVHDNYGATDVLPD